MANIKNKRYQGNRYRHIFKKRLPAHKYSSQSRVPLREIQTHTVKHVSQQPPASQKQQQQSRSQVQLQVPSHTEQQTHVSIEGSPIINIDRLLLFIDRLTSHTVQCGGAVILQGELRDGLASILSTCVVPRVVM